MGNQSSNVIQKEVVTSQKRDDSKIFTFVPAEDNSISNDDSLKSNAVELKARKIPVVFKYEVPSNTSKLKEVFVNGSFNNWQKMIPMVRSDNDFVTIIELSPGTYQYKFWSDGKWEVNLNEPTVDDGYSGKNNIVKVKESDFDVMAALREDADGNKGTEDFETVFCSEVPSRCFSNVVDRPPLLPPHLTNIILNRDTPKSCEPVLLPEPHHVMLKHLYALSIRDGVIVLSTTSRYRDKYVTTCFYKPM